jgi:hypothetical protein
MLELRRHNWAHVIMRAQPRVDDRSAKRIIAGLHSTQPETLAW